MVNQFSFDLSEAIRKQIAKEMNRLTKICEQAGSNSVILKNFQMPQSCYRCMFLGSVSGYPICRINSHEIMQNIKDGRPKECPLIDIGGE